MFYIIVITIATVVIATLNFLLSGELAMMNFLSLLLKTLIGTVSVIAVDGIFAFLIRRCLPDSLFNAERRIFEVSKKEFDLYRKLKIKRWKDLVPELGVFTGFSKSEISNPDDENYLGKFLLEANFGVVIHLENALFGFLIAFIPPCSSPSIWIPVAAVNFVLSMLPIFVLRFTSHTLQKLYKRSKRNGTP